MQKLFSVSLWNDVNFTLQILFHGIDLNGKSGPSGKLWIYSINFDATLICRSNFSKDVGLFLNHFDTN